MVSRGEIWWLDLGEPVGSAPGHDRPCIIVSSDRYNRTDIDTVTVVLLYSNLNLGRYPGNVLLVARDTGLVQDSIANVTQVGTFDRQQLLRRIGAVPLSVMGDIDLGLRMALNL